MNEETKFPVEQGRTITKLCPKCGTEIKFPTPDETCPEELAEIIAGWFKCDPCSKQEAAENEAKSLIYLAASRFNEFREQFAEYDRDAREGLTNARSPAKPGLAYVNMLFNGSVLYHRYLKLCGIETFPAHMNLSDMIIANPGEVRNVLAAYKLAAEKLSRKP